MDPNDPAGGPTAGPPPAHAGGHRTRGTAPGGIALSIGALGVVYGDIGTSPLYALGEVFFGRDGIPVTEAHALGAASLVFWALILVVTVKYVLLILRADNDGEGGIFAMLGLLLRREHAGESRGGPSRSPAKWTTAAVLIGAALLYGDGVITPAISVLSAVEGLKVVNPGLDAMVVPITVGILAVLFAVQKQGTHRIGGLFGPVMALWFLVLAVLGAWNVMQQPAVLRALNPGYAWMLLRDHGFGSLHVLGSVVLCVTGVEAMYADMGHFGRPAISRTWVALVLPGLVLNYLGQAAFLLGGRPVPNGHLFYATAPAWATGALVGLATAATIIASQALISGAFSLTQQATSLGFFPRLRVVHTNPAQPGQIFVPSINFLLFAGCVALVLHFRNASSLAAAYGLAVTGTMVVTTLVFGTVARRAWGWSLRWVLLLLAPILLVDLAFLSANLLKFLDGGYVPLLIGLGFFAVMDTWRWGRDWIGLAYQRRAGVHRLTIADLIARRPETIDAARSISLVVMASRPISRVEDTVPPVLAEHLRNWKRLPKHLIFFSVVPVGSPAVVEADRFDVIPFFSDEGGTIVSVQARYGYMEQPHIRRALARLKKEHRLKIPEQPRRWLILIGSERFVTRGRTVAERLRIALFSRMNRLAKPATDYFGLESDTGLTIETINV